ncbi:hypothetical protein SCA03_39860 [Streptomyces cacaoi]|uniref:Uncharacterized protein n=1 Tax=Streptomyces cacaoi TaxID=1898 RepID=A0A4Y3R157_STRCI|nr:hypothetical protein SCA03_39860 [Streptomyces cacaoi]
MRDVRSTLRPEREVSARAWAQERVEAVTVRSGELSMVRAYGARRVGFRAPFSRRTAAAVAVARGLVPSPPGPWPLPVRFPVVSSG